MQIEATELKVIEEKEAFNLGYENPFAESIPKNIKDKKNFREGQKTRLQSDTLEGTF